MLHAPAQAENFEAMGGYMFDPDEPGMPEKPITFADFLKKVLSMRSTRHAGSFSAVFCICIPFFMSCSVCG